MTSDNTTAPKPGWRARIKNSYKAIVALIGSLILLLSQIQELTPFLPAEYRQWIGLALGLLTAFSTFMVRNQELIDDL